MRQQHRDAGVFEDEAQSLAGIARVERHVCAPGLEHADEPRDHVHAALHADADRHVGSDTERAQMPGEHVGPGVELAVGRHRTVEDDGRGAGTAGRLRFEELVQVPIPRKIERRRIPVDDHALPFARGNERQLADGTLGIGDDRLEQAQEVSRELRHRRRVEEIGRKVHVTRELPVVLDQECREVELRRAPVNRIDRW